MVMNFPEGPETVLENIREVAPEFLMFGPRQWESLYSEVEGKMLDANQLQRFVYGRFMALGHEIVRRKMEHVKATWVMKLLRWLGEILIFRPVKDRLGLLKLRVALGGGSSMAPEVFHFFQTLGVDLRQLYGTSEHGFLTTHYDGSFKLESCGQRLKGDPAYGPTLEIDITAQGEIVVRGGPKFLGYYRNPAAMVARFDGDGWFHTGDAGYFDEDGHLIYLDRLEHFRELSTGHRFAPQYVETKLRHSPFIRDVLILGDEKKPYLSALIDIDPEMVGRWAERRGINFNAFTELSQKREVRELIRQEIVKTNRTLPAPSKVIRFVNLPKPFDPDEGDLTRSRKLRRELVEAHNRDIIDKIYSDQDSVSVESIVSYEDGKTGVVRALVKINSLDVEASA
jgi:long-chain acyl-CoA synthetase